MIDTGHFKFDVGAMGVPLSKLLFSHIEGKSSHTLPLLLSSLYAANEAVLMIDHPLQRRCRPLVVNQRDLRGKLKLTCSGRDRVERSATRTTVEDACRHAIE